MPLPSKTEVIARIRELADQEKLEPSRKARQQLRNLGFSISDACDMLWELEVKSCVKIETGKWIPGQIVVTFITCFLSEDREKEGFEEGDDLFVEVAINEDGLYLLACKQDGSPQ